MKRNQRSNNVMPLPLDAPEKSIIDWKLALKLAGNKRDLAEDMLMMLTKNLPEEVQKIRNAYDADQLNELHQRLHKLHGAVCYCGVPRFKKIIATLESALKQRDTKHIPELLKEFERESQLLLEAVKRGVD